VRLLTCQASTKTYEIASKQLLFNDVVMLAENKVGFRSDEVEGIVISFTKSLVDTPWYIEGQYKKFESRMEHGKVSGNKMQAPRSRLITHLLCSVCMSYVYFDLVKIYFTLYDTIFSCVLQLGEF